MSLYRKYQLDNLIVAVWKIEETLEELRAMFSDFSLYEERFACFSSEKRKIEWLAVRVLLKEICGEEKAIEYHSSGRPYLKDGSAEISFSHTNGYVAVAYSENCNVAVDIEQYGTRVKRIASRFIRDDEKISLLKGDEIYGLLLHWSAKETMFKLMDVEGVDFIEHLHIHPFIPLSEGQMLAEEYRTDVHRCFNIYYHTHPDYVLTYSVIP